MFVVGLNGGTASGKTEVAKVLQKKGRIVVSGDVAGREAVENNQQVLKKLVQIFGTKILQSNGKLNRKKLGRIAFASEKNQRKLNQTVHPFLLKELKRKIVAARKQESNSKFLVVDAALITEWGLEKELDFTVLVTSPVKLRLQRLIKQGLTKQEAQNRIARQLTDAQRKKKADYVIENDGSLNELKKKAVSLYHILMIASILDQMEKQVRRFDTRRKKGYIES